MGDPLVSVRFLGPCLALGPCYAEGERAGFPPDRALALIQAGAAELIDPGWRLVPPDKAHPDEPPRLETVEAGSEEAMKHVSRPPRHRMVAEASTKIAGAP